MGDVIIAIGGGGGLDTDECTAGQAQVLAGYTAGVHGFDDPMIGTMPNQGAKSSTLKAGGSYTIPAGYHNGSGKITADTLANQTTATASVSQILSGQTAWVNGNKITGTMANQGTKTSSLNCGGSYTIPAGYHNGSGKITANSLASQTSATAVAGDILTGKTAWVNGNKVTGTMGTQGGQTITPSASQQTVSCSGKKMTGNIVVNAIPSNYYNANEVQPVFKSGTFGKLCPEGAYFCSSIPIGNSGAIKDFANIENGNIVIKTEYGNHGITSTSKKLYFKRLFHRTRFKYLKVTYSSSGAGNYYVHLCEPNFNNIHTETLSRNVSNQTVTITLNSWLGGLLDRMYFGLIIEAQKYSGTNTLTIHKVELSN